MINNKLFVTLKPLAAPKARLFCFPYAGGSCAIYHEWVDLFTQNNIEVSIIQLPGRGSRFHETAHDSMEAVTRELLLYADHFTDVPYFMFGHSLGSYIAFDLCCSLKSMALELPLTLFASGSAAPHVKKKSKKTFDLPNQEFIQQLLKLGGTPSEVLENEELLKLLLPTLRADFKIAETYNSKPVEMPFPIEIMCSHEDTRISVEQASAWQNLTALPQDIQYFPRGHFFINIFGEKISRSILNTIEKRLICCN